MTSAIIRKRYDLGREFNEHELRQNTPVADADTMMKIILRVPGEKAARFCETAAFTFLQYLNPSEDFIAELQDQLTRGRVGGNTISNFLVDSPGKRVRQPTRHIEETYVYVRIRTLEQYVRPTDHAKPMTLAVIKPGITYDPNDRNNHLDYKDDNGFFGMAFRCETREEALIVEGILRSDYRHITAYDSYEYFYTRVNLK